MDDFARQLQIRLRAFGLDVVVQDGLAVAWCFREADVPGDDGLEHMVGEASFRFCFHLAGKLVARVIHGEEHAQDLEILV